MTDHSLCNFITALHEENQRLENMSKTKDAPSVEYELCMSKQEFEERNYPDNILRVCEGKVRYYNTDTHCFISESSLHYFLPESSLTGNSGSKDNSIAQKEAQVSKQKKDTKHTTTKGSNRSKEKTLHSRTESKKQAQKGTGKKGQGRCESQTEHHKPILTIVTWGDPMSDNELPTDSTMSGWGDVISDTELPTNSKRKPKT